MCPICLFHLLHNIKQAGAWMFAKIRTRKTARTAYRCQDSLVLVNCIPLWEWVSLWVTMSVVFTAGDIQGCGCGLYPRGVGTSRPFSEAPVQRSDVGELWESHLG